LLPLWACLNLIPEAGEELMYFASLIAKNLLRRKIRTGLTALGVALAVATFVALRGVADGFTRASLDTFEKRGVEVVIMAAGAANQISSDLDENLERRIAQVPGVRTVSPGLVELIELQRGNNSIGALVIGQRADSFLFQGTDVIAGEVFRPGEKRVALLGVNLANNLRKQVGDEVLIQNEPFRVIGIFRNFNVLENGSVWLPLTDLQELMVRKGRVTGFSVILQPPGPLAVPARTVCDQLNALTDERGKSLGLSAIPTAEHIQNAIHLKLISAMAWVTSVIAVGIAALGLVNTMAMSVLERVREIGILRALGWRQARVLGMILGESLFLSLAGAVVGILLALGAIRLLAAEPSVNGFIEGTVAVSIILQGVLLAVGIGGLGGSYPAYRASRLVPTEALRSE
jgi:putative ABC transport system permease protein